MEQNIKALFVIVSIILLMILCLIILPSCAGNGLLSDLSINRLQSVTINYQRNIEPQWRVEACVQGLDDANICAEGKGKEFEDALKSVKIKLE